MPIFAPIFAPIVARLGHLPALALAAVFAVPCAAAPALPATPEAWRAAAEGDIEAAVQVTRENHPGPLDRQNPGFPANLDAARSHGLALAAKVRDAAGYQAAVDAFNARLGDGHAGIAVLLDASVLPRARWPGFVTVWRGDTLHVWAASAGQPPVGSRLLGCDGRTPRELIRDNVFGFGGRAGEAGQWWRYGQDLFVDRGNPFLTLPRRCRFEAGGKVVEQELAWREMDAAAQRQLDESRFGTPGPVGMREARGKLFWVAMPTFHPNEGERAAYRAMNRDIEANRARYLAADAIVVDLRGNRGGSSSWSTDFARALWGRERVTAARAARSAKTRIWWRASPANTAYMTSMIKVLDEQGSTAMADWARTNSAGMRAALARGDAFHVEDNAASASAGAAAPASAPAASGPPPFTRPFYVIVPGNCASACLDALDIFTRFPNTTLVGAPSSADSTYMDVRRHALASGLAAVIVPMKVYVNRARANGEIHEPRLTVRDLVWSDENLLQAIEADLAGR